MILYQYKLFNIKIFIPGIMCNCTNDMALYHYDTGDQIRNGIVDIRSVCRWEFLEPPGSGTFYVSKPTSLKRKNLHFS